MLPDGFIVPKAASSPACGVNDKGKLYYNTTTNDLMVCDGTQWQAAESQWAGGATPSDPINYSGRVGINTSTPAYELDVNGSQRISGYLLANQIGVGTTTPSFALQVSDGDIAISSTADTKTWRYDYDDTINALTLKEDGTNRMIFANGGNVGIGSTNPTYKLQVDGSGYFAGDLFVNGGKGIVRSTTTSPIKCHVTPASLGTTFTVSAGLCATSNVAITSAGYTNAPTAQIGNLVSGTGDFGKLNINVQSTSTTTVVVRFCNNTTTNITLSNMVFNLMCIGQ
ncbi:hypothetical protein GCM10027035_49540 [Emticicia sediminis]